MWRSVFAQNSCNKIPSLVPRLHTYKMGPQNTEAPVKIQSTGAVCELSGLVWRMYIKFDFMVYCQTCRSYWRCCILVQSSIMETREGKVWQLHALCKQRQLPSACSYAYAFVHCKHRIDHKVIHFPTRWKLWRIVYL